ncbi:dienelactone hydrolase family protein [Pseudomonas sp. NPDC007930]|uniref:dienelactone hydrolase family protein n=1 Tax=Pseudomonas sp. NPDC007930 TaxID=3364417 RepID=UPI0036EAD716
MNALPIARTEAIPFETHTPTDTQFLQGAVTRTATIAGVLRLPQVNAGPLPAVIVLHGSGGYSAYIDAWVQRLNQWGLATFVVDSFSGRGLHKVADDQGRLGRLVGTLDAYRALETLARHPLIDPARVALLGFSRGGQGALYAAMRRFQGYYLQPGLQFSRFIALYPNCAARYQQDEQLVERPVHIFHGALDDFNSAAACAGYVRRLAAAGAQVALTVYPGAHHVFDWEGYSEPHRAPGNQSLRECRIAESPQGVLINQATGQPFSYADACVVAGTTAAYNAAAAAQVIEAIKGLLSIGHQR